METLRTATEEQDYPTFVDSVVHSVARTKINAQLSNALANRFRVPEVAELHSSNISINPRGGRGVQAGEPLSEEGLLVSQVLNQVELRRVLVTYTIPSRRSTAFPRCLPTADGIQDPQHLLLDAPSRSHFIRIHSKGKGWTLLAAADPGIARRRISPKPDR